MKCKKMIMRIVIMVLSITIVWTTLLDQVEAGTFGDFEYQLMADGTGAEITGYTGDGGSVEIPAEVEGKPVVSIGIRAFQETGLTEVTIPDSVTTIGSSAFYCNRLTSVTISDSVIKIGNSAFRHNRLASVKIPNSVTTIGSDAFWNNRLRSVIIPNSVTTIENAAFYGNELTSVEIPDSITEIKFKVFGDNQLKSVTIPKSVAKIGQDAFCRNQLTSVNIPESVKTIEGTAFAENKLTAVIIPKEVKSINDTAFNDNQAHPANLTIRGEIGTAAETLATNNGYTFEPINVVEPEQHILIIDKEGQGTTEPTEGIHEFGKGTEVELKATPAGGWKFDKWVINGEKHEANITVTMNEDKTATAYFEKDDMDDNWTILPKKEDVSLDKSWNIRFNREFSIEEIDGIVIERDNKFIPVIVQLIPEDKRAVVTPTDPYLPGETYNLRIFLNNLNRYEMYFITETKDCKL